jgi:fructosamine-3-kinase
MEQNFLNHLKDILNIRIRNVQPVTGGDISSAYKIETSGKIYFLKLNEASSLNMFLKEVEALKIIATTNTINTPNVINVGSFENNSYLLMDFIESKTPSNQDMALLGEQLAQLHLKTSDAFGFDTVNFIGTLPQSNKKHNKWVDFYIEERLLPQVETAIKRHLLSPVEVPDTNTMKLKTVVFFKDVKPSLLHGDLWSGNYLIATNGTPYLIDPATYYGHSEVDIAMSLLFGGFSNAFYETYHQIIPRDSYTEARIELYQLYYLLVHLNLFGSSYYNSVKRILNKYF